MEKWYKVTLEEEFKKNSRLQQTDIDEVQEWIKKQPHLPAICDLQIVLFLRCNSFKVNKTKENIENYYTMRTMFTNFFSDRDFFSDEIKMARETTYAMFLDGLDKEGNRVFWTALRDTNPSNYNPLGITKYLPMVFESEQLEQGTVKGYTVVIDCNGFVFSHAIKWTLTLVKQNVQYNQDGSNIPIVKAFFINVNSAVENVLNMAKKMMNAELANKITAVSTKNSDKIFDYIPKKIVPSDCGGEGRTREELQADTISLTEKYAEYFLEEEKLRVDESKRTKPSKFSSDIEGVQGSFKKIDLD